MRTRTHRSFAFASSFILVFPPVALALAPLAFGRPMPAWYERGNTTLSQTVDVGPTGASIRVPARGSPLDGIVLNIPADAVDNPVTISIGYNTGSLHLKAGIPSGTVLVVQTNPPVTFRRPITISVSFPPNPKHRSLVGYALDVEGRLRPIDLIDLDMKEGKASFLTFQPVTLTWVYIE